MTTKIELLPLPAGEDSSFGKYEVHDNETMVAYAHANIARAVAPLQAEIEKMFVERQKILDTQCFLFYDSFYASLAQQDRATAF